MGQKTKFEFLIKFLSIIWTGDVPLTKNDVVTPKNFTTTSKHKKLMLSFAKKRMKNAKKICNQIAKSEMLCKFELKAIGGKNRPNVCRC